MYFFSILISGSVSHISILCLINFVDTIEKILLTYIMEHRISTQHNYRIGHLYTVQYYTTGLILGGDAMNPICLQRSYFYCLRVCMKLSIE